MYRNDFQDLNAGRMGFDGAVHLATLINGMTAEVLNLFWRACERLSSALPGREPRKQQRGQVLPTAVLRDRPA